MACTTSQPDLNSQGVAWRNPSSLYAAAQRSPIRAVRRSCRDSLHFISLLPIQVLLSFCRDSSASLLSLTLPFWWSSWHKYTWGPRQTFLWAFLLSAHASASPSSARKRGDVADPKTRLVLAEPRETVSDLSQQIWAGVWLCILAYSTC